MFVDQYKEGAGAPFYVHNIFENQPAKTLTSGCQGEEANYNMTSLPIAMMGKQVCGRPMDQNYGVVILKRLIKLARVENTFMESFVSLETQVTIFYVINFAGKPNVKEWITILVTKRIEMNFVHK